MIIKFGNNTFKDILYRKENSNYKLKIDFFLMLFFVLYFFIALLGNLFLDYIPFGFKTIAYYFTFVVMIALGASFGQKVAAFKISSRLRLPLTPFLFVSSVVLLLASLYSWKYIFDVYGSFDNILKSAYLIRIGHRAINIPVLLMYFTGLNFSLFCIALVNYHKRKSWQAFLIAALFAANILICNFRNFGRVGILFVIFGVIAYWVVYNIKIVTFRNVIIAFFAYLVLMLPRLLRGGFDNFANTFSNYLVALKVKIYPVFYGVFLIFTYYFSSLYALSVKLNGDFELSYGYKNFAPLLNLLRRVFPFLDYTRISLQEEFTYIPFKHNIYSVVWDIVQDFGYFGLLLTFVWGLFIGIIFKQDGVISNSVKIFILIWIFFSPVYNLLSFGAYMISFIFLLVIGTLVSFNNDRNFEN